MTSQGRLVIKSHVSSADLMRTKVPKPTAQLLSDREGTVVAYKRADGQDVVGALQRAPQLRWAAVAETPSAEAFRELDRLRAVTAWILFALLAVVGRRSLQARQRHAGAPRGGLGPREDRGYPATYDPRGGLRGALRRRGVRGDADRGLGLDGRHGGRAHPGPRGRRGVRRREDDGERRRGGVSGARRLAGSADRQRRRRDVPGQERGSQPHGGRQRGAREEAATEGGGLKAPAEAPVGIEPTNRGFADRCLTTWLRRRRKGTLATLYGFVTGLSCRTPSDA